MKNLLKTGLTLSLLCSVGTVSFAADDINTAKKPSVRKVMTAIENNVSDIINLTIEAIFETKVDPKKMLRQIAKTYPDKAGEVLKAVLIEANKQKVTLENGNLTSIMVKMAKSQEDKNSIVAKATEADNEIKLLQQQDSSSGTVAQTPRTPGTPNNTQETPPKVIAFGDLSSAGGSTGLGGGSGTNNQYTNRNTSTTTTNGGRSTRGSLTTSTTTSTGIPGAYNTSNNYF